MNYFYTSYFIHKNNIYVRYVENGKDKYKTIKDYSPTLFVKNLTNEDTKFYNLYGHSLLPMKFKNIWESREYIKQYSDISNYPIYGNNKFEKTWIYENFNKKLKWKASDFQIMSLDIETEVSGFKTDPQSAKEKINIIGIHLSKQDVYIIFTTLKTYSEEEIKNRLSIKNNVKIISVSTEELLLKKFIEFFEKYYPHILTGWYSESFDIIYIINRIKFILGDEWVNRLSPFGIVEPKELKTQYGSVNSYDIKGIGQVDLFDAYKKFTFKSRPNYRLDTIGKIEINASKHVHSSGIPGHLLYRSYPEDAILYNLQDVKLVVDINNKTNHLELVLMLAMRALINPEEVMSPMRLWDNIILNRLADDNIYVEISNKKSHHQDFGGGYVKHPIANRYEWIGSWDVNSEYPSIIRAMNISPETIVSDKSINCSVEKILSGAEIKFDKSVTITANGTAFRKDKIGYLALLVKDMFKERSLTKKEMIKHKQELINEQSDDKRKELEIEIKRLDVVQGSLKVSMNSLYGILGSPFFRFFDIRMAEGITTTGQALIQYVAECVNSYLRKLLDIDYDFVLGIDTDSCYFHFGPIIERKFKNKNASDDEILLWINKELEPKVQKIIDKALSDFASKMNCFEPEAFAMKREAIARSGIFVAKKRYVLDVLDNEGVKKREIKVTGLESVKSSVPLICKSMFDTVFDLALKNKKNELSDYITKCYRIFTSSDISDIAYITSVSKIDEYENNDGSLKLGTTMQSRAAINYNRMIKKLNLQEKYDLIQSGDKIKFILLYDDNPTEHNVIAFKDIFPEEFNLKKYIDFESLFDKVFFKPVIDLTKAAKINLNSKVEVEDFF